MEFNDLLNKIGIDPKGVLILRHRPHQKPLDRVFPTLVSDRPDLLDAYQAIQSPRTEGMMARATHVAAFHGHEAGHARFLGLFSQDGHQAITPTEFNAMAQIQELNRLGMAFEPAGGKDMLRFQLNQMDAYAGWIGRLVVKWPGPELSWARWAANNALPIVSITEASQLALPVPHWKNVQLTWAEVQVLPGDWKRALSGWRGIYLIFDTAQAMGYVGSAGGEQNIWQRWQDHLRRGGDAKKLRRCDERNFIFSILEITNHEMETTDLVAVENNWKQRLHTVEYGLNDN